MPRIGVADLPLHSGHCPPWLFERMVKLAGPILEAIVLQYGTTEVLRRFADPHWFQAFGCLLGFDWHSSGLTTTVCGAVKMALRDKGPEMGLFVAGGKGAASRKTPLEIASYADSGVLQKDPQPLLYASRMAAKVDSVALQDGYDLYHHVLLFTNDGNWAVVQQGLYAGGTWARRYHWLFERLDSFVDEPHSGIISDHRGIALNLTDHTNATLRQQVPVLLQERTPEQLAATYRKLLETTPNFSKSPHVRRIPHAASEQLELFAQQESQLSSAASAEETVLRYLALPSEHAIPNAEHFDKALRTLYAQQVPNFEHLIGTKGVGSQTVRALTMVAEVIFGAPASFEDPVRYSFAHGGKDGIPYPVNRQSYDRSITLLEEAVEKARIGETEKLDALRRIGTFSIH